MTTIPFFDAVDEAVVTAMEEHGPDGHIDGHELIAAAAIGNGLDQELLDAIRQRAWEERKDVSAVIREAFRKRLK